MTMKLPQALKGTPLVPPIKCQGIKTKLVNFIGQNIQWDGKGRWIEPFLGSGVVAFNIASRAALLNDSNPYIILLYQQIARGNITPEIVREYLNYEGALLLQKKEKHFYAVRERFNATGNLLDFLFLSRSCFNGVMRFNSKGGFNVPFCHKPDRFRQAYVTKIVNQVSAIRQVMANADWTFTIGDWRVALKEAQPGDFVYLDPPYIGRSTDYYNRWSDKDAEDLARLARNLPCGVALSMWQSNQYRTNEHLAEHWGWAVQRTEEHFYHVGATEDLRNTMIEALLIKPGYESAVAQRLAS